MTEAAVFKTAPATQALFKSMYIKIYDLLYLIYMIQKDALSLAWMFTTLGDV